MSPCQAFVADVIVVQYTLGWFVCTLHNKLSTHASTSPNNPWQNAWSNTDLMDFFSIQEAFLKMNHFRYHNNFYTTEFVTLLPCFAKDVAPPPALLPLLLHEGCCSPLWSHRRRCFVLEFAPLTGYVKEIVTLLPAAGCESFCQL